MNVFIHPIAQAQMSGDAVGTIVTAVPQFKAILKEAITHAAFPKRGRKKGQGFVPLPPEACQLVTSGVAKRVEDPQRFIHRLHRGVVGSFLRRDLLTADDLRPESVAAIVYTLEGYLADPETSREEGEALKTQGVTHVLITVLASKGPRPQLSPERFVANMAGANKAHMKASGPRLREEAKLVHEYTKDWCVVG